MSTPKEDEGSVNGTKESFSQALTPYQQQARAMYSRDLSAGMYDKEYALHTTQLAVQLMIADQLRIIAANVAGVSEHGLTTYVG